jgi:hypothetical protein
LLQRARGRLARRAAHAAALCVLAVATVAAAPTAARAAVSASDRAATDAYLEAAYRAASAELANVSASIAAERSFDETLGRECAGVLAGAPHEEFEPFRSPPRTARQNGEHARGERQLETIHDEIGAAEQSAFDGPGAAARNAFHTTVDPLR